MLEFEIRNVEKWYENGLVGVENCKKCQQIAFVQAIHNARYTRVTMYTTKKEPWQIDWKSSRGGARPWYQTQTRASVPRNTRAISRATMSDKPGPTSPRNVYGVTQEFETCIVCSKGKEYGTFYGCMRWGHGFTRRSSGFFRENKYTWKRWLEASGLKKTWGDHAISWDGGPPPGTGDLGGTSDPASDLGYWFSEVKGLRPDGVAEFVFSSYFPQK